MAKKNKEQISIGRIIVVLIVATFVFTVFYQKIIKRDRGEYYRAAYLPTEYNLTNYSKNIIFADYGLATELRYKNNNNFIEIETYRITQDITKICESLKQTSNQVIALKSLFGNVCYYQKPLVDSSSIINYYYFNIKDNFVLITTSVKFEDTEILKIIDNLEKKHL